MYELIITEKPSAAQKIAEALADGKPVKKSLAGVPYYELSHNKKDIVVVGAAGHLYGVAESGERTYDYPVLEMEWVPNADIEKAAAYTKKYINAIKKLAKNASEFTIATDYDIEGETIGLNIVRFICKQKDANRMKFSTLTKQDLVAAYEHKQKTLDWGQAHAGETRHFLDWLYGINLSRALTQSVKAAGNFKVLSIGRVQGPALRLIVEKEREIAAFTPEDYWQIELLSATTPPFSAWHASGRFTRETDAAAVHARCKGARTANVVTVDQRKQQQQPPHPFDLGTLQTEAFRCFRIKPKQTLEIAQSLYSGGFISYPRTSSQKLPPKLGYKKLLTALEKQERYAPLVRQLLTKPLKPNNGKKDDPAHPAIYPTGTVPGQLGEREHKIYDLIVKRFLATFGPPAQRAHLTLTLDANGEHFTAKGAHTTEPGWHAYYAPYVNVKEEELPPLAKQDSVPVKNIVLHKKQTQPPKRYTQSSIITELEKRGLGTKATRADVVEALFKRNYAKGDTAIEATQLGMRLLSTLEKHSPRIVDEALTRHFEEELEAIRGATKTGENVLTEAKNTLLPILEGFRKHERALGAELVLAHKEEREAQRLLGACPLCKDGAMYLMFSKKNKKRFAGCSNYPDCNNTYPLPQKGTISG
ncbi:DNA topoisomerase I, partial [Candidatus Woesearchaeota archaeon]